MLDIKVDIYSSVIHIETDNDWKHFWYIFNIWRTLGIMTYKNIKWDMKCFKSLWFKDCIMFMSLTIREILRVRFENKSHYNFKN